MAAKSWWPQLGATSLKLDNAQDLLVDLLSLAANAEDQLHEVLPTLADAVSSVEFAGILRRRQTLSGIHRKRIETACTMLNIEPKNIRCEVVAELIDEAKQLLVANGDSDLKDVALIAGVRRIEHYAIAAYGCVRSFLQLLRRDILARVVQETVDEDRAVDEALATLADNLTGPIHVPLQAGT